MFKLPHTKHRRRQRAGTLSAAKRSYPVSEVRAAAGRSYPASEASGGQEETPRV